MKRILIASLALLACSAAFAQPGVAAARHHRHHRDHSSKHPKAHHARKTVDSVADRAQPLHSADFKP